MASTQQWETPDEPGGTFCPTVPSAIRATAGLWQHLMRVVRRFRNLALVNQKNASFFTGKALHKCYLTKGSFPNV